MKVKFEIDFENCEIICCEAVILQDEYNSAAGLISKEDMILNWNYYPYPISLSIGCETHTPSEWKKQFKEIAERYGYAISKENLKKALFILKEMEKLMKEIKAFSKPRPIQVPSFK